MRWRGLAGQRGDAPSHTSAHHAPLVWRGPEGSAAVPVGGGGAWPGCSQRPSSTGVEGAGGRWRGLAGLRDDAPSEARSTGGSRAGRRPPAHTAAGPSGARNTRGATSNANARQPERAAARSRSQWNTQRRREATTSATWTAFRAAPLRRLSPETTRTRPRLPSTA